jgi:hypothetical protein
MSFGQKAHYLRERAQRLREIAVAHATALSMRLCKIAAEMEKRAAELENTDPTAD